ncbi:hypothetical protein BDW72DRAFT_195291 [Aspergillus terricola var. indicus]
MCYETIRLAAYSASVHFLAADTDRFQDPAQGKLKYTYDPLPQLPFDESISIQSPSRMHLIFYTQGVLLGPVIFLGGSSILPYRQILTVERPKKLAIRSGFAFTFAVYRLHVALESYFCAPHVREA